ncbi:MAG: hypothetical protein FWE98_07425 [Oscillospiraceae bacterium]|nr:hypothetical protein [Oscillospiraceae bacterium]
MNPKQRAYTTKALRLLAATALVIVPIALLLIALWKLDVPRRAEALREASFAAYLAVYYGSGIIVLVTLVLSWWLASWVVSGKFSWGGGITVTVSLLGSQLVTEIIAEMTSQHWTSLFWLRLVLYTAFVTPYFLVRWLRKKKKQSASSEVIQHSAL